MKTFIRIEHKDGYGLFVRWDDNWIEREWSINKDSKCIAILRRHQNFPSPYEEGHNMEENHFCGFKNIRQLKEWFTFDELEYIIENNCRIFKVTINECLFEGSQQIIFTKDKVVSKEDITEEILGEKLGFLSF